MSTIHEIRAEARAIRSFAEQKVPGGAPLVEAIQPRPQRVVQAATAEEFAAIAHLREWCHDSSVCPICIAYRES